MLARMNHIVYTQQRFLFSEIDTGEGLLHVSLQAHGLCIS